MTHNAIEHSLPENALKVGLILFIAVALTGLLFATGPVAAEEDAEEDDSLNINEFGLQQDGEDVASVDGDEWDGELPEIEDPPMERYGGFVAVDLDAVALDEDGNEIDFGDDATYELGVEPQDEAAEELLRIEEHGDSVVLDGEGHGTAGVVFQIRDADGVEYETPVTTVGVDVPPGVNLLAETDIDHDHAAFHGEVDPRTAVEGGDSPGDGPVLEDDHVYWNVTYDGSVGYVTYDTTEHDAGYEGPFVFYVANGAAEPVNADVIERDEVGEIEGAGNVYETDTIEEYIKVETPDNGQINFRVSQDPRAVGTTEVGHDVAGIVSDDEPLPVSATALNDEDGNQITDEDATVQLVRDGEALAEESGVAIEDGELTEVTIDTTTIDEEIEPGPATVVIDGVETGFEDQIELVHEVRSLEEGFNTESIPQAATLHTEGVNSINQWDTEAESYVSLGENYDKDDVIDSPGALHRGLYVDADSNARFGYEFETTEVPTPGGIELENGWHLASSNFALGEDESTRDLEDDLVNIDAGGDGITVFDEQQRTQLGTSSTIERYGTYWVYVDEPDRNVRGIVDPNYDAPVRSSVLEIVDPNYDAPVRSSVLEGETADNNPDGDVTDDGDNAEETTGDAEGDDVDTASDETDDTSDAESADPHPDEDHEEATDAGAEDDSSDETAENGSGDEAADSEMTDETSDEELESETSDEDRE